MPLCLENDDGEHLLILRDDNTDIGVSGDSFPVGDTVAVWGHPEPGSTTLQKPDIVRQPGARSTTTTNSPHRTT